MANKFLIVGSNSFSAASFISYLLSRGEEVIGVSRSPEASRCFLPYKWRDDQGNFTFVQSDLNKDLEKIIEVIDTQKPEYIVNFAAQGMVAQSWENPEHWFMTNVVSTVKFHNKIRTRDFLKKYIHVTTPEVYGSTEGFIKESFDFNPSTPYAVSRAACDMSLKTFHEAYDFPVVFTRAANVYGPGQQLYRIIPRALLYVRLGKKMQLHGGGHSRRSFIHMKDVSEATWRIALEGKPGETYHISTNEIISIRGLVERICEKMGADFDSHVEIVGERLGKDAAYQLDSGKLRRELGWSDKIGLDEGLDDCLAWLDRDLEEIKRQPYDYIHKP
ncbi:MAG: GDP-mannose 4,6-dehydratase [Nitrospinota bacterium]|nr:GDP-mannose 4,6-dehydratase [Nitrospinota bacterium]